MEYDTGISFTDDDDLVFSNEEGELRTYSAHAMLDKLMKKADFYEYGFTSARSDIPIRVCCSRAEKIPRSFRCFWDTKT